MRVSRNVLAALTAGWMAVAGSAARADDQGSNPDLAATAVHVSGDVRLQVGTDWQAIQEGQLLASGDRVVTGDESSLQLVLVDGSSVALASDSELTLNTLGSGAEGSVTLLTLARGLLDAMVQKLKLGSHFEIQTPYAVAAVKGTDFEVNDAGAGSSVTVNEGTVQMGDSARRHFEAVRPQEQGIFQGDHLMPARPLSRQERQSFQRRWAGARALHARRRELLRRFRPMRRRFLRQLRRRQTLRSGMGRSGQRGRRGQRRRDGRQGGSRRRDFGADQRDGRRSE